MLVIREPKTKAFSTKLGKEIEIKETPNQEDAISELNHVDSFIMDIRKSIGIDIKNLSNIIPVHFSKKDELGENVDDYIRDIETLFQAGVSTFATEMKTEERNILDTAFEMDIKEYDDNVKFASNRYSREKDNRTAKKNKNSSEPKNRMNDLSGGFSND